jgi:hypothetical protein
MFVESELPTVLGPRALQQEHGVLFMLEQIDARFNYFLNTIKDCYMNLCRSHTILKSVSLN